MGLNICKAKEKENSEKSIWNELLDYLITNGFLKLMQRTVFTYSILEQLSGKERYKKLSHNLVEIVWKKWEW